jgi:two-component system cell cycle sensor histidine kinase/response regulator CckA
VTAIEAAPRLAQSFRRASRLSAAAALGVGAFVLVGWLFDVRALVQVVPGAVAMVPNTAVGFLLVGLSLWLQTGRKADPSLRVPRVLAAAAGLLGLLELAQYVSRTDLGIDQLLFRDPAGLTSVFPGRMAVLTAIGFMAIAAAVLTSGVHRARLFTDALALVPALLALLSLTGYAYGVRSLVWIGTYKGMAIHTALGFIFLTVGALFARPDRPLSGLMLSESVGGLMVRRVLPLAIAIPFVLGWLERKGRRAELYQGEFGVALLVVVSIVLLAVVVVSQGATLERIDRERSEATREMKRAFESLRKLSGAVEQSPVSVVITDTDGNIEYVNPKFTQATGYSSDEVLGMNPRILKSGEQSPEVYRDLWETITAGREWRGEFHNQKKNGELFWEIASISPILDEQGRATHFVAVMEDITDRKRAEETLALGERHFRSLIENAQDIITIIDVQGTITFQSPAAERILGRPPAEFVGKSAFEFLHPDDVPGVREAIRRSIESPESPQTSLFRFRHANGTWRTMEGIGKLLPGEGTPHVVINSRDVTERGALEEQLRQSQKMEAVGRLAGGIAHDFNNLLTVIGGYGEMLLNAVPRGGPNREPLEEIVAAGERAASLTRQLLAFSRKQILMPEVLDLNAIVAGMDKMLRRLIGEDVDLVTRLDTSAGGVRADPGQIEQVIMNLAVNARDAMPRGGKLTIETANADLDKVYARRHATVATGPYVMMAVSDTGVGMHAETEARIFEPFFTTKEKGKGTGLGLSTVYGIVKQSGGNIWVYSEPGKGTTFKIYLPRVEEAPMPHETPSGIHSSVQGTETILVVEDEVSIRTLARKVLESGGYRVVEAKSGPEALERVRGSGDPIHLLVTDLVMPEMAGTELASRLLESRPELRVLYMSGYSDDAVVRHGLLEHRHHFLPKPFTPQVLLRKVREVLDAPEDQR